MWARPGSPPWPRQQKPEQQTASSACPLEQNTIIYWWGVHYSVCIVCITVSFDRFMCTSASKHTWKVLGQYISLVRKTQILQHVLHLLLSLCYWTAFQQRVEEDVLCHSHTDKEQEKDKETGIQLYSTVLSLYPFAHVTCPKTTFVINMWGSTYYWKRTLCWGHIPRDCRMVSMSVRMSFP